MYGIDKKCAHNFCKDLKGSDHPDDIRVGTDGRIVLKLIINNQGRRLWTEFIRIGNIAGLL
jgi:hypothetical protein